MKNAKLNLLLICCLWLATVMTQPVSAQCLKISTTTTNPANSYYVDPAYGRTAMWSGAFDANRGILNLPVVNITDESFQPNGTLLGSSIVPFTTYGQEGGYDPEQVLFRCDTADENGLYEIYSVNADNAFSGQHEDGVAYGVERGYATYVKNLVTRVKNNSTGQYFSKLWQYRSLRGLDRDAQGRILVKAKNFSDITVELFRIGDIRGYTQTTAYSYNQPAAYIAFGGPGLAYPEEGRDHTTHYPGWYGNWPGNISLYKQLYTRRAGGCAVTSVTPYVLFPTVTIDELKRGVTREANIQINYRCQASANINGLAVNANAIAFKIDASNYQKARALGLTNLDAVTYLVSDAYGDNNVAKGVGVTLVRNDGVDQPFLNFENRTSLDAQYDAKKDGWRPLLGNRVGTIGNSYQYIDNYQVIFGKLPGIMPTAGKYYAKAEVLIRVQ
ncbi:fimbrial protein [Shewanella baltica]|uniref:fimbrial protein n=1 Tax=Shewanella baltica TaxID=62322 RepID=UPI0030D07369